MSTISIPWGTAYTFRAPIVKASSTDYAIVGNTPTPDWTPAAGDVKISKDGGAFANITTLPTFIASAAALNWTLSAAETEATEVVIQVIDSATKAVQDQFFRLQTTKASALQVGVPQAAQSAGDTAITLDATAAAQTDFYKGSVVAIISGDGANQARIITAYNGTTKVATIDRGWDVALTTGGTRSVFAVFPQGLNQPLTSGQTTAAVPTTAQIATEIFDTQTVEAGMTFRGALRLMGAVLAGRRSGTGSGTEVFNAAVTNAKPRVTATIDGSGNRTNVTTDQTP
jgi:spore maturation protein SpmB